MKIGIIDYGVGNLASVARALEELRATPVLVKRAIEMQCVDSLILPGAGNFSNCAHLLNDGGWSHAIRDEVRDAGKPLLGICLGMQLLANSSMEGVSKSFTDSKPGLGLIPGRVVGLRELGCSLKIPHVGWNEVTGYVTSGGLFDGIPDGTDFYFVHSYAFIPDDPKHTVAIVDYGIAVTAAVRFGNIWGTQFHPEKSSQAGFRLLRNFIENSRC
jgi:glutamine amidotransferase